MDLNFLHTSEGGQFPPLIVDVFGGFIVNWTTMVVEVGTNAYKGWSLDVYCIEGTAFTANHWYVELNCVPDTKIYDVVIGDVGLSCCS